MELRYIKEKKKGKRNTMHKQSPWVRLLRTFLLIFVPFLLASTATVAVSAYIAVVYGADSYGAGIYNSVVSYLEDTYGFNTYGSGVYSTSTTTPN